MAIASQDNITSNAVTTVSADTDADAAVQPESVEDRQPAVIPQWSDRSASNHVGSTLFKGKLSSASLEQLLGAGETLFNTRFTSQQGLGRPLATQAIIPTKRKRPARNTFSRTAGIDASSCAGCHNEPVIGGAGDFTANVFVSEGFQHTDFDTTDPQFSNERNTNHLFGAGLVELLAREMTNELHTIRRRTLDKAADSKQALRIELLTKGVSFGTLTVQPDGQVDTREVEGVDSDLVIRPFSQKGVMTSLRQFTINALNQHHGMQANERFGARWTGETDHDEDGVIQEISIADVSALVAWQATLPPPSTETNLPDDWQLAAARGSDTFDEIACNRCHRRSLPLDSMVFGDPGPYDAAGTLRQNEAPELQYDLALLAWAKSLPRDADGRILVPLFGDLKRHEIADNRVSTLGNELLSQRFVERNVFMTTELWGIASTAPYGHRGDLSTLSEVIAGHGGAARASRESWLALQASAQDDVIAYLKSLVISP
ncbi:MAG: di-heme oxidoredictase family protein [Granulosicoccus sp.]